MLRSSLGLRSRLAPVGPVRTQQRARVTAQAFDAQSFNDLLAMDLLSLDVHLQSSLLTLSDVAASLDATAPASQDNGWLQPLVGSLETVLKFYQSGLVKLNVPYSYGWSIVLLTLSVKLLTFPLTKKQVESSLAMQKLKPQLDALKARYGDDKDQIQKETSLLYQEAGVDPLAGCLPSLATIPIFIGLYRSLTSVASDGLLDKEGFFWIPTLAGPTTMADQQAGLGSAWLFPFVDGHPPIGWDQALPYLVFPVALFIGQYISMALTNPPIDDKNEGAKTQKAIIYALPLMIGWFSLNVPSGLALYYFSNTFFTTAIQVYLKKLGGADVKINLPLWTAGTARRTASDVLADEELEKAIKESTSSMSSMELDGDMAAAMGFDDGMGKAAEGAMAAMTSEAAEPAMMKRCKRRRTRQTIQMAADALGAPIGDVLPTLKAETAEATTSA